MRKFGNLQAVYMSFYSKELYQDIVKNWSGICISYFLLLIMLYLMPEMFRFHRTIAEYVDEHSPKLLAQVPVITIKKGEVSMDAASPHFIPFPNKPDPLVIIDTSGTIDSLDNSTAFVLLTKNRMLLKREANDVRTIDLKEIDSLSVDKKRVGEWIELFKDWIALITFPVVFAITAALYFLLALLAVSVGRLFTRILNVDLNYQAILRLVIVSFTPATALQAAHSLLDIDFPMGMSVSFLLTLGYLYNAIWVNAAKEQ
ncbi:MAG: DUF1189 domain-containing protein [Nitrospirae bacterium]|nr:MAG: DUF1189 domain-containing protein [Nitrospirota bacterium]